MANKLTEYLVTEAISLGLTSTSSEDVIRILSNKLLTAGYVRESFADACLLREQTIPTGLPLGGEYNVAIPHTDIEHVIKSGIGMATLTKPVTFQNMVSPEDAVDVRLVFILALDQPKSQIEMLQEIAGVLQNETIIKELINATSLPQVMAALK